MQLNMFNDSVMKIMINKSKETVTFAPDER